MYVSWSNHFAELTASVIKEVTCECCGTEYVYAAQRSEIGQGTSLYGLDEQGARERSVQRANEHLQRALDNAFELVPCPNCGAYQSRMVTFLQNANLKWLSLLGALLAVGAIGLFFGFLLAGNSSISVNVGSLSLMALGVSMIVYKRWSSSRIDPNAGDAEPRKQLGKSLAMLKADLPNHALRK